MNTTQTILSTQQMEQWKRDGFLCVSELFTEAEIAELRDHFMDIQREALNPDSPLRAFYQPRTLEEANGDILQQYPRVMHPHRFDELSKQWLFNSRTEAVLQQLFDDEPIAAQSMMYFKPSGARGQALHQDNFYLNVRPGTCVAGWLALDEIDEENGGMCVVPGSQKGGVACPHMADMDKSFTTEEVDVPEGHEAVPVRMKAGDILFFNGEMIHGSTPNISQDRFRRAFICHYVPASTTAMSQGYLPLMRFDGSEFEVEPLEGVLNTCGAEDWETFNKLRSLWFGDGHPVAPAIEMH